MLVLYPRRMEIGDVGFRGGNPEDPEKNLRGKAGTNNKFNPHMAPSQNRTLATLVGGSRHCAIPSP